MRFRDKEGQMIWERYMGNYSEPEIDMESPNLHGEEDFENSEVSVIEFEPEMEVEVEEEHKCNEVIYSDVKKLAEYSKRILEICNDTELEPWMQAKLVKASDYVSDIWHRLDAGADFANTGEEHSDNISL